MQNFPDYRKTLEVMQEYAKTGPIDEGILSYVKNSNTKELIKALREKNWKNMRQWVANNTSVDPQGVFRIIYDALLSEIDTIPQMVVIIADYQYKAAFVADQEINLTACLTELMGSMKFK